ncbi:MAG: hypothetical protein JNK65_05190 [Deltaproteobacteria bacterium]|nr:hypothetical protein [Deltaproteobacteria bacterium]
MSDPTPVQDTQLVNEVVKKIMCGKIPAGFDPINNVDHYDLVRNRVHQEHHWLQKLRKNKVEIQFPNLNPASRMNWLKEVLEKVVSH